MFCPSTAVRLKMSIFSDGVSEIHPELCAIDLPRVIHDSAGLSRALEAIDTLVGPKSLNPNRKQYVEAISILTPGLERDLD
jgi:hypothetical protein